MNFDMETVVEIKISDIRFFGQSRKDHYFKSQEAKITELAESIRRVGILEPLIVRKDKSGKAKYELIAGETRLKAAQKNGMEYPDTGQLQRRGALPRSGEGKDHRIGTYRRGGRRKHQVSGHRKRQTGVRSAVRRI